MPSSLHPDEPPLDLPFSGLPVHRSRISLLKIVSITASIAALTTMAWLVFRAPTNPGTIMPPVQRYVADSTFTFGPGITCMQDTLLAFRKASVADLMKAIGHCYRVPVEYLSDTPQGHYTGRVSYGGAVPSVVGILNAVGIRSAYDGQKIVVANY